MNLVTSDFLSIFSDALVSRLNFTPIENKSDSELVGDGNPLPIKLGELIPVTLPELGSNNAKNGTRGLEGW